MHSTVCLNLCVENDEESREGGARGIPFLLWKDKGLVVRWELKGVLMGG